jgi:uncharacterized protein
MALIRLPAAQHAKIPWKNGLGVSRIIASEPTGSGYDALLWQVGSTEIAADCPFSSLPQLDRLFMVIEGKGVELTSIDESGKTRIARVEAMKTPYAFRGDWKTDCRLLDGPVRVLNASARRGRCSAKMEIVSGLDALHKALGEILIAVEFATLDAWRLDGPVTGIGSAALVRITQPQ